MFSRKLKSCATWAGGLLAGALMTLASASLASAADPVRIGLLLPYSGTFAVVADGVDKGLRLALEENDNKLGGRDVTLVAVDSEANPGRAVSNMQKLITGENVDLVVGPVHSGVAMGALNVARDTGVPLVIPNAGLDVATRQMCAPNIFRTSFSNWQTDQPMGKVAWDRGFRRIVTLSWRYAAGEEHLGAFEEAFKEHGGEIVRRIMVPFPDVEFQAQLTEIAQLSPDAVFVFFAGGGAVKFVQDYARSGLKDKIPLIGSGFLTEGVLEAQGPAAEGIQTIMHYADGLDNESNRAFRAAFEKRYGKKADLYAVQGYDTGKLLVRALEAVQGDTSDREALLKAISQVKFDDSPRGAWAFSKAHNPIQDIYLREVRNGENVVIGIAAKALDDPATGCTMTQ